VRFQVSDVAFVNRALAQVDREMQAGARIEMHAIGELVAGDAEQLALSRIRRVRSSPQWADMRVGQNNELVYVVPWQRGTKSKKRKRKNFAPLMLERAMRPALTRNEAEVTRRFEKLKQKIVSNFNKGKG